MRLLYNNIRRQKENTPLDVFRPGIIAQLWQKCPLGVQFKICHVKTDIHEYAYSKFGSARSSTLSDQSISILTHDLVRRPRVDCTGSRGLQRLNIDYELLV